MQLAIPIELEFAESDLLVASLLKPYKCRLLGPGPAPSPNVLE